MAFSHNRIFRSSCCCCLLAVFFFLCVLNAFAHLFWYWKCVAWNIACFAKWRCFFGYLFQDVSHGSLFGKKMTYNVVDGMKWKVKCRWLSSINGIYLSSTFIEEHYIWTDRQYFRAADGRNNHTTHTQTQEFVTVCAIAIVYVLNNMMV